MITITTWLKRAQALQRDLIREDFNIEVELRSTGNGYRAVGLYAFSHGDPSHFGFFYECLYERQNGVTDRFLDAINERTFDRFRERVKTMHQRHHALIVTA